MSNDLHKLSVAELEKALGTDASEGLSVREARVRLVEEKKRDGGERSYLFVPKRSNYLALALSLFSSPGIIILITISLLAALFGNLLTGLSVMVITVVGAVVGGVILQSSRRRLDAMKDFASPMLNVKRGGSKYYTDGRNIVAGDVLILSKGDLLPCDARIISSRDLVVKELINTKDGVRNRVASKDASVEYTDDTVKPHNAENMLLAGSAVLSGDAIALVVATGKETYLSEFLKEGELAGGDNPDSYIHGLKPLLYRVSFVSISAVALLSLLSLVTLRSTSFVSNFLMLVSAVAMLSLEVLRMGQAKIFATVVDKLSRSSNSKKKKDLTSYLRGSATPETLTRVTHMALLGRAALYDGNYYVESACVSRAGESLEALDPATPLGNRILTCIHTYLMATRRSGSQIELVREGITDSLSRYIKSARFDTNGASLILKSLYFADDKSGRNGYACAETVEREYRVVLTLDDEIVSLCEYVRAKDGNGCESLEYGEVYSSFANDVRARGGKCLYVISETSGKAILEGALALYEKPCEDLGTTISEISKMSARTLVMLESEDEYIIHEPRFKSLFEGEIALASDFRALGKDICDGAQDYCAYMGFSTEEYASLINHIRQNGGCVAAYGIDSSYYEAMSHADLAISCDILNYSSSKYKESVYEKLPSSGRDSNLRCSQMTRLLSRVIVHRSDANGGGLLSVAHAMRRSRAAYISFAYSIFFFAVLMTSLISMTAMSAILGIELLNAVQASCLAAVFAVLAMTAFADAQPKFELLYKKKNFSQYSTAILSDKLAYILARAGLNCSFAIILKLLDVLGVFGESASYTMPVFVALLLSGAIELFVIVLEFTRVGEGRRASFTRFMIAYALVLVVGGLITQDIFARELFPGGMGMLEFIIVPVYCIIYLALVFSVRFIEKNRKKG